MSGIIFIDIFRQIVSYDLKDYSKLESAFLITL